MLSNRPMGSWKFYGSRRIVGRDEGRRLQIEPELGWIRVQVLAFVAPFGWPIMFLGTLSSVEFLNRKRREALQVSASYANRDQ